MSKKLKPLTIFLSDDELVNFKSHFDEFLNMNCDDKIKEQQEEIEKLNKQIEEYQKALDETTSEKIDLENIIEEVREYIELGMNFDSLGVARTKKKLLEILDKVSDKE